jgi:hypothetical protein
VKIKDWIEQPATKHLIRQMYKLLLEKMKMPKREEKAKEEVFSPENSRWRGK